MGQTPRKFRTDTSITAESITRAAILGFLARHGFTGIEDQQTKTGTAISQIVTARDPDGASVKMHVRLCWRRDGSSSVYYSAAQLRSKLVRNDWDETLRSIVEHDRAKGVTHTLIVKPDQSELRLAALVPRDQLNPIWQQQRIVSADLLARGRAGKRRVNHVTNGQSPTIWLQDDRTPDDHAVADVLWNWPGVVDVNLLPLVGGEEGLTNDSIDDLGAPPPSSLAGMLARRSPKRSRALRENPLVRAKVQERADGRCEREGCGNGRSFKGFLDVHHILGVGRSDRPWSCVALCPNCHREAHFAPERESINAKLGAYAAGFR